MHLTDLKSKNVECNGMIKQREENLIEAYVLVVYKCIYNGYIHIFKYSIEQLY